MSELLRRAEPLLLIAVGGFAGAIFRYLLGLALPGGFPWGTIAANVSGSFLLGERIETGTRDTLAVNVLGSFLLGVVTAAPVGEAVLLAVGTGFCGAFTTFSTFAFETVRLAEEGESRRAVSNAVVTLVAALVAVGAGVLVGRAV